MKQSFRSEALRRAVASLECIHCGAEGISQAAHSNAYCHGKAKGRKADDRMIFPLCATTPGRKGCHEKFDQYELFSKIEAIDKAEEWTRLTLHALLERGLLVVKL